MNHNGYEPISNHNHDHDHGDDDDDDIDNNNNGNNENKMNFDDKNDKNEVNVVKMLKKLNNNDNIDKDDNNNNNNSNDNDHDDSMLLPNNNDNNKKINFGDDIGSKNLKKDIYVENILDRLSSDSNNSKFTSLFIFKFFKCSNCFIFIVIIMILSITIFITSSASSKQGGDIKNFNNNMENNSNNSIIEYEDNNKNSDDDDDEDSDDSDTSYEYASGDNLPNDIPKYVEAIKIAQDRLRIMIEENDASPIIVGGIGDSGTRGARLILAKLGVQMLKSSHTNSAGDSKIFMKSRKVIGINGKERGRTPSGLYNSGFRMNQGTRYDVDKIPFEYSGIGIQFVANMIVEHMEVSKAARQGEPLSPFGFKHPRTALILPYFNATIPHGKWKYVFVIRDARDVATGDNQKLLRSSCHKIYPESNCKGLQFWANVNTEIFLYLKEILGNNFFLFRTEDFVSGNRDSFERLAKFVGSNVSKEKINKLVSESRNYNSSYFGNEWSKNDITSVDKLIEKDDGIVNAMTFFGYDTKKFGLSENFSQLYQRLFPE